MTTTQIILVILCAAAGATIQGSIGIGFALVAAPGLVAIDPAFAPGPLLVIAQIVGVRHLIVDRDAIDREALRQGLFGIPLGLVLGIVLLEAIDQRTMALVVGGATALGALVMLSGFQLNRSRTTDFAAGALSAFGSTAAGLPGPPLVAMFSDMRPATMRSTCSGIVLAIAIFASLALAATGNFSGEQAGLLVLLLPGVLIGLVLARFVRPHVDRPEFRQLVLVLALLGGVALIIRTLI